MSLNWKSKIGISILDGLKQCYDGELFTDTEIEVEGVTFKCHKVFLCAISDYFRAMFSSGMRESLNGKVALAGITSTIFRDVLTFYYEGRGGVVRDENVEEILKASTLLQLRCLQDKCEDFYIDQLTFENAVGIWQLAKCLHCASLSQKSKNFILMNFVDIGKENEILGLEAEDLCEFLHDDDLRAPSEDIVLDIAVQWIQHDADKRKKNIPEIFRSLRKSLLSDACLHKVLDLSKSILNNELNLEVKETIFQRDSHSEHKEQSLENLKPRNYEEVLVTIGVRISAGLLPSVNAYSFIEKRWFVLEDLPVDPGVGFAVCTFANDIYISGRSGRKTYLMKFDSELNQWFDCPEMLEKRCYHEMVSSKDSLYVLGGCNKRDGAMASVDVYTIAESSWRYFSHLVFGVYSTSAAIIGNSLFVFGGRGMGSRRTTEVQLMDLTSGTASIVTYFHCPITESRALTLQDEAFVFCTNGTVMKVFEDGALFQAAKISNFDRYNFGVFLHRGCLVVTGGDTRYPSGPGAFDDMIMVSTSDKDTEKETLLLEDRLYPSASAFGCQKIILKRTFLTNAAVSLIQWFPTSGRDSNQGRNPNQGRNQNQCHAGVL